MRTDKPVIVAPRAPGDKPPAAAATGPVITEKPEATLVRTDKPVVIAPAAAAGIAARREKPELTVAPVADGSRGRSRSPPPSVRRVVVY